MQPDGTYRQLDCADLPPDDPRAIGVNARLIAYYADRAADHRAVQSQSHLPRSR
jgi:hypothetical protein